MFGHVISQDGVAGAHRLDKRGVRAADLGRLDVSRGMRPQHPVSGAIDRPDKADPRVGGGVSRAMYAVAYGASPTITSGRSPRTRVYASMTTCALFSGSSRLTYRT